MEDIEGQEPQQEDPRDKRINDLLAENANYRAKVRTAEAARISSAYGITIEPDDLKGTDAAVLEKALQQMAGRQPAQAAEAPAEPPKPEAPETKALAQAADLSGPPGAPQRKYTYAEAKQLPWEQRREAISQGLVEDIEVIRHHH